MLAEDCLFLETQVLTNSFIAGNSFSPNIGNPFPSTVIVPILRCILITKSFEQYKSGARMNSFQTDKKRLPFWIRGLTLRYWESLGKCEDFSVQWDDKRKIKLDEIQITLETTTQATRQTKQKLFVIKIHLKIGTITDEQVCFVYVSC
jgi:hypothetical protein